MQTDFERIDALAEKLDAEPGQSPDQQERYTIDALGGQFVVSDAGI